MVGIQGWWQGEKRGDKRVVQARAGEMNYSSNETGQKRLDVRDVKEMEWPDVEINWQAWGV